MLATAGILLLVAVFGSTPLIPGPTHGARGSTTLLATPAISPSTNLTCNAVWSPTPSSLYVPLPVPSHNLTPGGNISAALEVQILNFSSATNGTQVYFPGIFFKFPLAAGGNFSMFIAPKVLTITSAGWSAPALLSRSSQVSAGLAFKANAKATLTSMKLAVMASAAYGAVTMEVRWHWGNTPSAGAKAVNGSWSVPTTQSAWPKSLPTIFYPAPWARLLNSTGSTAIIGTNWTADLGGMVGGMRFFLEMEFPGSGHVVQANGLTAPANATNFTVSISMLNYVHSLAPGTYLVHIHDACGAMLYNKSVKAVFASSSPVTFYFVPGVCGPITINGTKFTNGTTANLVPSTTAFNFSLASCKGHSFSGWSTSGAIHIVNSKQILVSGSGTFTVRYN